MSISLDQALDLTRTGDVWLFRGRTMADRAIQLTTNSPVNHVGMSVVIEDMPALMWHAELGKSLPDRWAGTRQRGVQLHDLRDAVLVWSKRYGRIISEQEAIAILQSVRRLAEVVLEAEKKTKKKEER